jgi:hypothetical protein
MMLLLIWKPSAGAGGGTPKHAPEMRCRAPERTWPGIEAWLDEGEMRRNRQESQEKGDEDRQRAASLPPKLAGSPAAVSRRIETKSGRPRKRQQQGSSEAPSQCSDLGMGAGQPSWVAPAAEHTSPKGRREGPLDPGSTAESRVGDWSGNDARTSPPSEPAIAMPRTGGLGSGHWTTDK